MRALLQTDGSLALLGAAETRVIHKAHPAYARVMALYHRHAAVALSAAHAPAGYTEAHPLTIAGHNYTGGEFVPADVVARANPAERAALRTEAPPPATAAPFTPPPGYGGHPWAGGTPDPSIVYNVPVPDIHADPERFQFKLNTDKAGVTQELKGVEHWNPDFAGVLLAWQDPADRRTYVINGHHRLELARRLGVDTLPLKYVTAASAKEARAIGALVNIAEGRGTALDAAKFMKDTGRGADDMAKAGVSLKGKVAADAVILARLNDRLFDRLARGQLDQETGLAIARHLADPNLQDQLAAFLAKKEADGKEYAPKVVEVMAKEMAETPTRHTTEHTLFGDLESDDSLFGERNELKHAVRTALARELGDFLAVASERRAGVVGGRGNVLDVEGNKAAAEKDAQALATFDRLVNRKGPVSDALNAGAAEYAEASTRKAKEDVRRKTLEAVRAAVESEQAAGTVGGGMGPGEPGDAAVAPGAGGAGGDGGPAAPAADAGGNRPEPDGLTAPPAAEPPGEPARSRGHLGFAGRHEYYRGDDGRVYKAGIGGKINPKTGNRAGNLSSEAELTKAKAKAGAQPDEPKPAASPTAPHPAPVVEDAAAKLRDLHERAAEMSYDDIERQVKELADGHSLPELRAIARAAGIHQVGGSKADLLKRLIDRTAERKGRAERGEAIADVAKAAAPAPATNPISDYAIGDRVLVPANTGGGDHEPIAVTDPTGNVQAKSFAAALRGVAAMPGRDDDRVTLQSPHGYSVTRTRGEWRQVANAQGEKPEAMAQWYDRENPETESQAARESKAGGATMAGAAESEAFFAPKPAPPANLFARPDLPDRETGHPAPAADSGKQLLTEGDSAGRMSAENRGAGEGGTSPAPAPQTVKESDVSDQSTPRPESQQGVSATADPAELLKRDPSTLSDDELDALSAHIAGTTGASSVRAAIRAYRKGVGGSGARTRDDVTAAINEYLGKPAPAPARAVVPAAAPAAAPEPAARPDAATPSAAPADARKAKAAATRQAKVEAALAELTPLGFQAKHTETTSGKPLLVLRGDTKPHRELIKAHGGEFWAKNAAGQDDPRWGIVGERKIAQFLAAVRTDEAKQKADAQRESDRQYAEEQARARASRVNLKVSFDDKDRAKRAAEAAGGRLNWDAERRVWWAPNEQIADAVRAALGQPTGAQLREKAAAEAKAKADQEAAAAKAKADSAAKLAAVAALGHRIGGYAVNADTPEVAALLAKHGAVQGEGSVSPHREAGRRDSLKSVSRQLADERQQLAAEERWGYREHRLDARRAAIRALEAKKAQLESPLSPDVPGDWHFPTAEAKAAFEVEHAAHREATAAADRAAREAERAKHKADEEARQRKQRDDDHGVVARHGRTVRGDGEPQHDTTFLGHGRRAEVEARGGYKVGDVIQTKHGPLMVVEAERPTFVSADRIEDEDAWGDYPERAGWYQHYRAVPVERTPEERAAHEKQQAAQAARVAGRAEVKQAADLIREQGEYPDHADIAPEDTQGEVVPISGMDSRIYGGGEWFVVGPKWIWHVRNNGHDGDDWSYNNFPTGGAGAIAHRVPYTPELAERIRAASRAAHQEDE